MIKEVKITMEEKVCPIPNAANFAQQLKAWRKEKGLTQKQLGELLGISKTAVYHYEQGARIPIREIAYKLAAMMGVNSKSVPFSNQTKACHYNEPFNDEERRFAELYHNCVFHYLHTRKLSVNDWYDVVIFGYLYAVKKWFARPDLHKYSFLTIAYKYMWTAVRHELEKQKHRPEYRAVSLYDVIPGTDSMTYADILCDPRDCVGI